MIYTYRSTILSLFNYLSSILPSSYIIDLLIILASNPLTASVLSRVSSSYSIV